TPTSTRRLLIALAGAHPPPQAMAIALSRRLRGAVVTPAGDHALAVTTSKPAHELVALLGGFARSIDEVPPESTATTRDDVLARFRGAFPQGIVLSTRDSVATTLARGTRTSVLMRVDRFFAAGKPIPRGRYEV